MPIIDVAIDDAFKFYIRRWTIGDDTNRLNAEIDAEELAASRREKWLKIHVAPILQCDDQKTAAWAALEAVQWTNGSGVRDSQKSLALSTLFRETVPSGYALQWIVINYSYIFPTSLCHIQQQSCQK